MFFKGRLEFLSGRLDESLVWYSKSWQSQNHWPQFHHLCFWELLWVNCCKLEWKEAGKYASRLLEENKWSRTIYSYQRAAVMSMCDNKTASEKETIANLLKDVPKYKQRIAGKSLPLEKFAVKKAERFFDQNHYLMLPAIELMFLWNYFKIFRKNGLVASGVFKVIEKELSKFQRKKETYKYDVDNKALLLLLKGSCLRHMKSPLQAQECLEDAIALQKEIKSDTYIVPYAIVELGMLVLEDGNNEKALLYFEDAR